MKRVIINISVVLLLLIVASIVVLGNTWINQVPVATVNGSYAEEYAEEHHLEDLEIADSIEKYLDIRYESFDYNLSESGIVVENYSGISENLVIPDSIGEYPVVALGSGFFDDLTATTDVYLPLTVMSIESDPTKDVVIHIDSHSYLVDELGEDDWNVDIIDDSEYIGIDFDIDEIPFMYNINNGSIELTSYTGDNDIIFIPSHINGYPVTTVSFDMLEYEGVVFPDTVQIINGKLSDFYISPIVIIEIAFCFLAAIISLVAVNVIIPSRNGKHTNILSLSQSAISIGYVMIQLVFGTLVMLGIIQLDLFPILLINTLMLIIYLVNVAMISGSKTHVSSIEQINEKTIQPVKDIKAITRGINTDEVQDPLQKKRIEKILDSIRYLAPSSDNNANSIDAEIKDALGHLTNAISNDKENTDAIIAKLDKLISQRRSCSIN